MSTWLLVGIAVVALILFLPWVVPRRVRYQESTIVEAPSDFVYDNIRLQTRLMQWSAWPTTTGSDCRCEGADGEIGARTVFLSKDGRPFGHQVVTGLVPGSRVDLELTSKGPPQTPTLSFLVEPHGPTTSQVTIDFQNNIRRPFNVLLHLAGIVRWTRKMHVKDLEGLKRFSEAPHVQYDGRPAVLESGTA